MAEDREHCPGCMCHLREIFLSYLAECEAEDAFEDGELDRLLDFLNDERGRI